MFKSDSQNFWQLASIQASAMGLPVMLVGGQIAAKTGPGIAVRSIFLANLILWLIDLAITSMSAEKQNDIESVFSGDRLGIFACWTCDLPQATGFSIK